MLLDDAEATADPSSSASPTIRLRKRIGNKDRVYGNTSFNFKETRHDKLIFKERKAKWR
jgi:hypothetical protein